MIIYRPTDGDVYSSSIDWLPRTCFLMTQLGEPLPDVIKEIRAKIEIIANNTFKFIDADSQTTGRDFLLKICFLAASVPVGIAIIHENISHETISNIFYELGWMQALGKETLVIKVGDAPIPSDLIRTEYIPYDKNFDRHFRAYIISLQKRAEYYLKVADNIERDPLLAIVYLRRAYLLTGDNEIRMKAINIFKSAGINDRAKNSVEKLMIGF